jgi:hypothetical protein
MALRYELRQTLAANLVVVATVRVAAATAIAVAP